MIEYSSLFISSFLSATLLPGSSEVVLAGLVAMGGQPVAALIAVATLGNTLGACVNWGMGVLVVRGSGLVRLPISAEQVVKFSAWYARFGVWSLLLSWVPVIGDPLTVAAGLARTPLVVFVPVVAVGKIARYAVIAGIADWTFRPISF